MSTSHLKLFAVLPLLAGAVLSNASQSILRRLSASPRLNVSTVPSNGDLNPYGVAYVPRRFPRGGLLRSGDILVSNFNNSANLQGTGTTIMRIGQNGHSDLFFQGSGLGLTTALGVLSGGYVLVGNVPTTDGTFGTIGQGSLLVLHRFGHVVQTLTDSALLDGPWDLTINDRGFFAQVFVSNVLSGTVTRLDVLDAFGFTVIGKNQIASGYAHRSDPAALAVGPTGLAYDSVHDELYVAATGDNTVYRIAEASRRRTDAIRGEIVFHDEQHLRGPLGLVLAKNGNLITANGDAVNEEASQPSEMVEFTRNGKFVDQVPVDPSGQGGAFGLALVENEDQELQLAAADDLTNTLKVWDIKHDNRP